MARAATASTAPAPAGAAGMPPVSAPNGSATRAAPLNCTAVTARTSRPSSSRGCATVTAADISADTMTRQSPAPS